MLLHEKYAHLESAEDLLPLSLQIVRFKIMSFRRKAVRRGEYTQVSITDLPLPDLRRPIRPIMSNENRCWNGCIRRWASSESDAAS